MSSTKNSSSKESTGSRFDLCLTPPYSLVVEPRRKTDSTAKVRTSLFPSSPDIKPEKPELSVGKDEECILNLSGLTKGIQDMLVCANCKSNNVYLTARHLGVSSVVTIKCHECDVDCDIIPKIAGNLWMKAK